MPYELTVKEKAGYLYVTVTGDNTKDTVLRYLSDVYAACAERKCPVVLIEENLAGPPLGVFDIYEVVGKASQSVYPTIRRIAFVDMNPEHNVGTMKFAEDVATNLGVKVRVFSDLLDAEKWLGGA